MFICYRFYVFYIYIHIVIMLSFVVTKVTSDFVSRIWFYLLRVLVPFLLWTLKIQGGCMITRVLV